MRRGEFQDLPPHLPPHPHRTTPRPCHPYLRANPPPPPAALPNSTTTPTSGPLSCFTRSSNSRPAPRPCAASDTARSAA
ncbi:uncharacterized protein K441DRAFT_670654 [Cenococcum geophilum 1.58]|uniref:Uncharacterized protein n=1 Tax=Cenococcum geophilum 1.58 TaxID=794803 RepID=A0ACC8EPH0_9PEZI|nr:hypothetical protein K441DRAFT_670654 [Cenococcum geophilum 1.58]